MPSRLPINLEDLLRQRTVERDRIEYKTGWNPDATIRTLCAFANDFENLGGGYVIIGQDCDKDGRPVFPPVGVPDSQLDKIQRELLGFCNQIQPPYFPVLSIEKIKGKNLIVLWAPGGQNRPYTAPKEVTAKHRTPHYYIRRYSSTVEARGEIQRELLSLTATVPFDDRMCHQASVEDIRLPLVQAYLKEVRSGLHREAAKMPLVELGRQMNIVEGGDEFVKPRNVGVLFFNDAPEQFLPGAQIDLVVFPKGPAGPELIENTLRGPIHEQVRAALRYIQNNVIREKVIKHPDRAEATRIFNYPFEAIEEALVNAIYHRGYDQREPVEVRVHPEAIYIVSYPGPDPSIRTEDLAGERILARRYRNRRIGEFLKELDLTEGRCTGIPIMREAMAANGSPPPKFSTDEGRTYFLVELPIHPDMGREQAQVKAQVKAQVEAEDLNDTERRILIALQDGPMPSNKITAALGHARRSGGVKLALTHLEAIGFIELTIPEKPRSRNQMRRLTEEGRAWLARETARKNAKG
jgi:ATP-dependent DNA helicase RecG